MTTADAGWLYAMSRRGDVVEYTGTDRQMTLENGYGDWNLSFADWKRAPPSADGESACRGLTAVSETRACPRVAGNSPRSCRGKLSDG